ncbi:MAG: YcxB family protein [Cyclobacteriaceae bacterium]
MTIQTKAFKLTPGEYFRLLVVNRIRRFWWLYLGSFIAAIIFLPQFGSDNLATFIVIFGFLLPPLIFAQLYFWSKSKRNKLLFDEIQFVIDERKIVSRIGEGTVTEVPWENINRSISREDYWMLYISKGQFFYIPRMAFHTDAEIAFFEQLIEQHCR